MLKLRVLMLAIFAVVFTSAIAFGEIMSTSGQMVEVDFVRDAFEGGSEDSSRIRVFDEIQNESIDTAIFVNFPQTGMVDSENDLRPARLIVGSPVSSHFIHSDPVGLDLVNLSGCVTFDEEIIGVIILDAELDGSDSLLGLSNVTYQDDQFRGFEFTSASNDSMDISNDRRTICVDLRTSNQVDQVRVVTSSIGQDAIRFEDGGDGGDDDDNGSGDDGGDDFPFGRSNNCDGLDAARFDVTPGNRDNIIHPDNDSKTITALYSSEEFDAPGCIDPDSLTFGPTGDEDTLMACGSWDINMDGYNDLQCDFVTMDADFEPSDDKAIMRGRTHAGDSIMFMDRVDVHAHRPSPGICSIDDVRTLKLGRNIFFGAQGNAIAEVRVQIFSVSGQLVYNSGFSSGQNLRWNMRTGSGQPVANGVYLYLVTVKGQDGQLVHSGVKKLMILR